VRDLLRRITGGPDVDGHGPVHRHHDLRQLRGLQRDGPGQDPVLRLGEHPVLPRRGEQQVQLPRSVGLSEFGLRLDPGGPQAGIGEGVQQRQDRAHDGGERAERQREQDSGPFGM
jgi:hypothetical protein